MKSYLGRTLKKEAPMKLYLKEFDGYKNIPTEKQNWYYQPNLYFDLELLPTVSLQNEMAAFLIDRGNTLTFQSLYIDLRTYNMVAKFLSDHYSELVTFNDLDMDSSIPLLKDYLVANNISPTKKSNNTKGYVYHPAIYYIQKIHAYFAPQDRIYFKDLSCYKVVEDTSHLPDTFFDFTRLPNEALKDEFKEFTIHRGCVVSYGSLTDERRGYMLVSAFLSDVFPTFTSLKGIDTDKCIRKFRAWLLKNEYALTYKSKRRHSSEDSLSDNSAIAYLRRAIAYFIPDDGLFHFEDDTWYLNRIDESLVANATKPTYSISFEDFTDSVFNTEVKKITLIRLSEVKVSTAVAELHSLKEFCSFLSKKYPQISSLTEVDREVIESYLVYLYTEDTRRKSYRSELMHLKSSLHTYGKMTETKALSHLFFQQDFNKATRTIYRFYTDAEIKRLNAAFKLLPEQYGRAMILHEILGCRISETLSLKSDCITTKDDGTKYIRIKQHKVNREYEKPINADIEALINKAIAYTTEKHGICEYVFVSDKNPTMPMQYSALYYQLQCLIFENKLIDDNGNLFTVGTHIFRHVYGKRLCDMGLDDSTIAKLLGHSGTGSVAHYRKMGDSTLAKETKTIRSLKDEQINKYKGGWN